MDSYIIQEFLYIIYKNITYIAFTYVDVRIKYTVYAHTWTHLYLQIDIMYDTFILNFTDLMNIIIHILIDINIDVDDVHVHM